MLKGRFYLLAALAITIFGFDSHAAGSRYGYCYIGGYSCSGPVVGTPMTLAVCQNYLARMPEMGGWVPGVQPVAHGACFQINESGQVYGKTQKVVVSP